MTEIHERSRYRSNSMASIPIKTEENRRSSLTVLGQKAYKKIFK